MSRYTKEQRFVFVKTHYKFGESFAQTVRKVREIFGIHISINEPTIRRLIKKFEEADSIMNKQALRSDSI